MLKQLDICMEKKKWISTFAWYQELTQNGYEN